MKKFIADRKGAFAMQFALLVVPLTVCTGLAIDGGRAFLARYELASALDAAALAVGSTYNDSADLNIVAHSFVNANFRTAHNGPIELTLDVGDDEDDVVLLKGKVKIDTYFMPLVGQPTVTVAAESQVRRGGNNVEVALALDITESMSGSRITALKEAARDLIDTVVSNVQTPYFSKVAIVPWGNNVHVGADLADDIRGPLTGPTAITGVSWRDGTAKAITASSSGWRKNAGGTAIASSGASTPGVTWRNGSRLTISSVSKLSDGHILVQTSSSHGYSNGDTVYLTGIGGSFTFLSDNKYRVADRATSTFELQDAGAGTYISAPSGTVSAWTGTGGRSQRCFNSGCEVRITTSSTHALAAGDYVHISGVGSPYTFVNNANDSPWTVSSLTAPTSTQFFLAGSNGPSVTSTSSGGSGYASECYNATCKYVVTANNHGLSNDDRYIIYNVSSGGSGSGTSLNTTAGTGSWAVENATTNTFTLPGDGQSYKDWSSGGSVAKCFNDGCTVKVTSASHGLGASQYVRITSVGGITGINNGSNASWQVASVSGNDFYVSTWGPGLTNAHSNYSSNTGSAQCLASGCLQFRYTDKAGNTRIGTASNCITERTGTEAYSDAAPSDSFAGPHYPASDSLTTCNSSNSVMPLSSNKTALKNHITNMDLSGSTAGQIGTAWGWYMVSPNWGYLWSDEENRPKPYDTKELAKVVVLMTDGEFNTAHCQGVQSSTYGYSSISSSSRINCDPSLPPFDQAEEFCDAMKAKKVIVYTVGFELNVSAAEDFLEYCATSPQHVFLAANATELKAAFKTIATSISKLRIAK